MPNPVSSKIFLLTPVRPSSESHRPELQETLGLLSGSNLQEQTGGPGASRTPLCLALPGLPAAPEGRPEEEEEDSEDSDESDEELRCYSIQEPSEESEEEVPPVPVVVAESQSARNLRSLLKMPSLLSEAFCEDLERKKKAVSFFDDVTVYLFDQVGANPQLTKQMGAFLEINHHTLVYSMGVGCEFAFLSHRILEKCVQETRINQISNLLPLP